MSDGTRCVGGTREAAEALIRILDQYEDKDTPFEVVIAANELMSAIEADSDEPKSHWHIGDHHRRTALTHRTEIHVRYRLAGFQTPVWRCLSDDKNCDGEACRKETGQ